LTVDDPAVIVEVVDGAPHRRAVVALGERQAGEHLGHVPAHLRLGIVREIVQEEALVGPEELGAAAR